VQIRRARLDLGRARAPDRTGAQFGIAPQLDAEIQSRLGFLHVVIGNVGIFLVDRLGLRAMLDRGRQEQDAGRMQGLVEFGQEALSAADFDSLRHSAPSAFKLRRVYFHQQGPFGVLLESLRRSGPRQIQRPPLYSLTRTGGYARHPRPDRAGTGPVDSDA
jgi:hypothetical protein